MYKDYVPEHSNHRTSCPECGLDLVFIALVVKGRVMKTWMCDCGSQDEVCRNAVIDTREASPEAASVIEIIHHE